MPASTCVFVTFSARLRSVPAHNELGDLGIVEMGGAADDAGAAHMFDYDYETGIVKFEYEGSEEDLIEIAKQDYKNKNVNLHF